MLQLNAAAALEGLHVAILRKPRGVPKAHGRLHAQLLVSLKTLPVTYMLSEVVLGVSKVCAMLSVRAIQRTTAIQDVAGPARRPVQESTISG